MATKKLIFIKDYKERSILVYSVAGKTEITYGNKTFDSLGEVMNFIDGEDTGRIK